MLVSAKITPAGQQAKQYWASILVPENYSCERGIEDVRPFTNLEEGQIMQMNIIHDYWACSTLKMIDSKNGRLYQLYASWRASHDYHSYIQDEAAKSFFSKSIALWASGIYMEKNGFIKTNELQLLDKFHIYQFMQNQKSLLKNNFTSKYAKKSLSSAYFTLLNKENIDNIHSVYYGGDVEYILMGLWLKYQDTATNLLYEETPM